MIQVKFEKMSENAITPERANLGDVGFDLFSIDDVRIYPGKTVIVHTGIRIDLPEGYFAYVSSKSGPAGNNNVHVLNSPGLIDNSFRGEILVILHKTSQDLNHSDYNEKQLYSYYEVTKGKKIAQFVILPYPEIELIEGKVDINTQRGEGKLGSSGLFKKDANSGK